MRLPFNYIAKGNAVHEIYAKAGVPFPAGLPSAEQEQETDYIKIAPADLIEALGWSEYYPTNPFYSTDVLSAVFLSDVERSAVTLTCTVGDSVITGETPMGSYQISDTNTEYDGMYAIESAFQIEGLDAGEHEYEIVISADGQTYTFNGTFTVEAENQENNEQE